MTLAIRLRVWTDPEGRRWIVALGFAKDFAVVSGPDVRAKALGEGVLSCWALRGDDSAMVKMGIEEWEALPVVTFREAS